MHRRDCPTAGSADMQGCNSPDAAGATYLRLKADRVTSAIIPGHGIGVTNPVAAVLTVEFDGDTLLSSRCVTLPVADSRARVET